MRTYIRKAGDDSAARNAMIRDGLSRMCAKEHPIGLLPTA